MGQLIPVRLLARVGSCNPDEVAGYPPDVAAQLIASGRAVPFGAESEHEGEGDEPDAAGEGAADGQDTPASSTPQRPRKRRPA